MTTTGWLPAPVEDLFGADATAEESYDVLTVDVPPASWTAALRTARDELSCTYFDWLSAVDEPGTGFRVAAHVVALAPVRRLLLRTTVPHEAPVLASAVDVYAGAGWHERETREMFGVAFEGHPYPHHLLLPENFEGHPLRKDFVLAARVAKAWPGAKEPGEPAAGAAHGAPKRRQMLPPGVPDPNDWGPLKGQLPPAPARPARAAAGRAAGDRPARPAPGERPPRRTRSAAEGSASQAAPEAPATEAPATAAAPGTGAASGATPPPSTARRTRTASGGSASQRTEVTKPAEAPSSTEQPPGPPPTPPAGAAATEGAAPATGPARTPRSSDAPWHHARPAFDDQKPEPTPEQQPTPERERELEPEAKPEPAPRPEQAPELEQKRELEPEAKPELEQKRELEPEAKPELEQKREPEPRPTPEPE
ncbi:NADH-quinone oxidoreductase subunit C, partial [Streptomyces sp. DSM 15324]|uniref:NADH-quinone oxidoreductase subunit C n=1 Tax=Streptomyces sp. DSM 15324 TaxID=1739111 RepID=UPI0007473EB7